MPTTPPPQPEHLVLYDGACGFCSHAVRWILDADTKGRFFFAPLDGPTATAIRHRQPAWPPDIDSIVYVERCGATEHVYVRAEAVFRICSQLETPGFRRLARLRYLPGWITNIGYRVFAANRRRISRSMSTCPIPTPAQREHLIP